MIVHTAARPASSPARHAHWVTRDVPRQGTIRTGCLSCELDSAPNVAHEARQLTIEFLRACQGHDFEDAAKLISSELATNAYLHGRPPVEMSLNLTASLTGFVFSVMVSDHGDFLHTCPESGEEHGRGLEIVEALSDNWSVVAHQEGTSVRADIHHRISSR